MQVGIACTSSFSWEVQNFWGTEKVEVKLKRCNDRALNRDLEPSYAKVAKVQPRLQDWRRLLFRVQGAKILRLDAQKMRWGTTLTTHSCRSTNRTSPEVCQIQGMKQTIGMLTPGRLPP